MPASETEVGTNMGMDSCHFTGLEPDAAALMDAPVSFRPVERRNALKMADEEASDEMTGPRGSAATACVASDEITKSQKVAEQEALRMSEGIMVDGAKWESHVTNQNNRRRSLKRSARLGENRS